MMGGRDRRGLGDQLLAQRVLVVAARCPDPALVVAEGVGEKPRLGSIRCAARTRLVGAERLVDQLLERFTCCD